MKEYKKTYLPLILWSLALMPVMLCAVPVAGWLKLNDGAMIALMMAAMIAMLLALFGMVWKGEYVYWINGGPSFEEAREARPEVRREYAWKHLLAMLKGSAAALILLAAECIIGAHGIVMVLSASVCIAVAAFSTVRIRWPEEKHDSED